MALKTKVRPEKGFIDFKEVTAPGSPSTNVGRLYVADNTGTTTLYFKDSDGTATALAASGTQNTLDQSYDQGGAGAGRTITADSGAVNIQNTDADNAFLLTLNASPATAAASGGVQITIGANSTQDAIELANSGSGKDIYGTGGTWSVSKAGAAEFTAVSGVSALSLGTLAMTGDITLANGQAVKASETTAETMSLQVYDVDGAAYRDAVLLTNGNTPAVLIGDGTTTVQISSAGLDVSAAGAISSCTGLTFVSGAAAGITLASDGAADDLTISVTGANDSSLFLISAGTGEDAVRINASAGGVDIDALAAKDINIAGGQVALVSKDDAASAISLTANIGTTETIVVTNTQGTSESAITLVSTAGGVNVDAAAAKDLDLAGGQVKLVSKDNATGAISLTANVGTTETITVTNTQGTSEAAITLLSTAGGIDMDGAAAKDINIAAGQVALVSKDNAAGAISLTANIGTSETITVTNTQGTGAAAITLTATAGGITLATAAGKTIYLNGNLTRKVGSDVASPAGGELDLGDGYSFNITGTNNITSIAAADTYAGREIMLLFASTLTFTDGNNLKIAGNFSTSADDTITLICHDGTNWHEKCRSAN